MESEIVYVCIPGIKTALLYYLTSLFQKLLDTKDLEDKITRELLEKVFVDKFIDDRIIETVP